MRHDKALLRYRMKQKDDGYFYTCVLSLLLSLDSLQHASCRVAYFGPQSINNRHSRRISFNSRLAVCLGTRMHLVAQSFRSNPARNTGIRATSCFPSFQSIGKNSAKKNDDQKRPRTADEGGHSRKPMWINATVRQCVKISIRFLTVGNNFHTKEIHTKPPIRE